MAGLPAPKMSKTTYRLACLEAKPHLARILDIPFDLNGAKRIDAGGVGVYVACSPDMHVTYVGSVHRPQSSNGLADRIDEHRNKASAKRAAWRYIWFVPMHSSATRAEVRRAEARIGTMLRPPMTQRLPIG